MLEREVNLLNFNLHSNFDWVYFQCQLLISTCIGTCRGTSRIKSYAATAADPQHPWKELRVENASEAGTLCLGKRAGQGFREMLSGADLMSPTLVSPHI